MRYAWVLAVVPFVVVGLRIRKGRQGFASKLPMTMQPSLLEKTIGGHATQINTTSPSANRLGDGCQPVPSDAWRAWIRDHGSLLVQPAGFPDYEYYSVTFEDVVLPGGEGPCQVTFITNLYANGDMTFQLYGTKVLKQLLSNSKPPQLHEEWTNGKLWDQALRENQVLSLGIQRDGASHIDSVATHWAAEEDGGVGCFSRGKSLVQLAEMVACKFGQKSMALLDSAYIQCRGEPKVTAGMSFYYALKTGQSWYQSLGYQYTRAFVRGREIGNPLRSNANVNSTWAISNNALDWSSSHLETPLSLYKAHLASQGDTEDKKNRDFMLWVWEKHCVDWEVVGKAIFGAIGIGGPMSKALTCDH